MNFLTLPLKLKIINRKIKFEYNNQIYQADKYIIEKNSNLILIPTKSGCLDEANFLSFDKKKINKL